MVTTRPFQSCSQHAQLFSEQMAEPRLTLPKAGSNGASISEKLLEETGLLLGVGPEEVLGVLVVSEHHEVVLAADAGLLVAAERRVGRVGVVLVYPCLLYTSPSPRD